MYKELPFIFIYIDKPITSVIFTTPESLIPQYRDLDNFFL